MISTILRSHGLSTASSNTVTASLDHAMWFHRPFRADDWLLYTQESPTASGDRGLTRGQVFDTAGRLVASIVQEALVRLRH